MTYDAPSATNKMYIDGRLVGDCTGSMSVNPSTIAAPKDLFIGRALWKDDDGSYLPAELGCFRMYGRALR